MNNSNNAGVDLDFWLVRRGWNPCAGKFITLEVVELCDEHQNVIIDAHWVMPMQTTAVSLKRLLEDVLVGARKTRRDMKRLIHALGKDVASRVPLQLIRKIITAQGGTR